MRNQEMAAGQTRPIHPDSGRKSAGHRDDDPVSTVVAAIVAGTSVPMAAVSPEGVVLAWNRGMESLSRISMDSIVNAPLRKIFHSPATEKLQDQLGAGAPFQVPFSEMIWNHASLEAPAIQCDWLAAEFVPVRIAGRLRAYTISPAGAEAIFSGCKDVVNFVRQVSGSDDPYRQAMDHMSERRRKLMMAEKLAGIGELAAGVAHEINNPVGYVYSNLNGLREYLEDIIDLLRAFDDIESMSGSGSPVARYIADLRRRIDLSYIKADLPGIIDESMEGMTRVKRIVQSLKDFSHIGDENFTRYDLHDGIDATIRVAENEIKYRATIVREYGELPLIECLPSQINQVVLNLLVNAAQSIESGGRIMIRTGSGPGHVWLEITDDGCGIEQSNLSRLFEPFFTTKPVGKGAGLGLPLSYSIVRKHHGDITVQSEIGVGSVFRVTLPVNHDSQCAGLTER